MPKCTADQGSQYTAESFQHLLTDHGATCIMSHPGNCRGSTAKQSRTCRTRLKYLFFRGLDQRKSRAYNGALFLAALL